jgi:hypothetical protein
MEEIAWVLRSNPNRKTIGFVEARRLKEDERPVLAAAVRAGAPW